MATLEFDVQHPPVRIDWSDGTVEDWDTSPANHLYAGGGQPTVILTDGHNGKQATVRLTCPIWNTVTAGYPTWNAVQAANATWVDVLNG